MSNSVSLDKSNKKGGSDMENTKTKSTIDELIAELSNAINVENLLPEYDEDALMVHWSSSS